MSCCYKPANGTGINRTNLLDVTISKEYLAILQGIYFMEGHYLSQHSTVRIYHIARNL